MTKLQAVLTATALLSIAVGYVSTYIGLNFTQRKNEPRADFCFRIARTSELSGMGVAVLLGLTMV